MTKTFEAKPGDRWTKYPPDTLMYLYRDGKCTFFRENRSGVTQSRRQASELDLPTPDALAQLREWGYVVTGDVAEVKPLEVNVCLITESRVREIVAEMLAAHPTPAEVREAIAIANDPNTKWHDVTEPEVDHDNWQTKCKVWQPTPNSNIGEPWAAHSPSGKWSLSASSTGHILGWDLVGGVFLGRNFKTEADARAALAKAPPPPDVDEVGDGVPYGGKKYRISTKIVDPKEAVAPEPDWKGLLKDLVGAISDADIAHGGDGDTRTQQSNAWRKVYNSPALTAARTNGGGK